MNRCICISGLLVFALVAGSLGGCSRPVDEGKIPLTTKSDEAMKEYIQGRDMLAQGQSHEANAHSDRAIAADTGFAMAYLQRAGGSASTSEFMSYVSKAVSHSGAASEGERLTILAAKAASIGDMAGQRENLEKLVAAYPKDERAHEALAFYFSGQQENDSAVFHFKAATEIAPAYPSVYNGLGYAYRAMEKYPEAEQAFRKYIELVPSDPNPYDSYAELLMKEGKFDQSMENYKLALTKDPNFVSSKQGVAFNFLYMGKSAQAASELQAMMASARDDGERGLARFAMMVLHIDGGNTAMALQVCDSMYAVAERQNDVSDMAGALDFKGAILEEAGKNAEAMEYYDREMKMIESSSLPAESKESSVRTHHFNAATIALATGDVRGAKTHADELEKLVAANPTPARVRGVHELYGRIALGTKEYDRAIGELQKANMLDAHNLYRLALAYQGKGDTGKAREYCERAAHFYSVPDMGYAAIRLKAEKMLAGMKG